MLTGIGHAKCVPTLNITGSSIMPNLTLSVPHQLGRAEAKRRLQEALAQAQQQSNNMVGPIEQRWNGDTLDFKVTAMGQTLSGQAVVEEQVVRVEVALPWMLALLAGSVKQQIEQRGRQLLGHRTT
jgi:hypothetical protein